MPNPTQPTDVTSLARECEETLRNEGMLVLDEDFVGCPANIIARHDPHDKLVAENARLNRALNGEEERAGIEISKRHDAEKAHAETLRLLWMALPSVGILVEHYHLPDDVKLYENIRAHLAAQKGSK